MTDQNEPIPPANVMRVAIDNPYEVRRWCQRLVCTEAQLRAAVASVGSDPQAIRAALQRADRLPRKSG